MSKTQNNTPHLTGPFPTIETEVTVRLLKASCELERELEAFFDRYGLTPPQYNVLRVLLGHREGCMSGLIAKRLIHKAPDVTRLVDRMIAMGLTERRRDEEDRRRVFVFLTPAGLKLVKKIDKPLINFERGWFAHMSPRELTQIARLLEKAAHSPETKKQRQPA